MRGIQGYTLLEMVVVITLLGLATAMVAPAGYRMIGSWREATAVQQVVKSLASLPLAARAAGRDLRILPPPPASAARVFAPDASTAAPTSDVGLIDLPEGWAIQFKEPLLVRANGACSNSQGTLVTQRQHVEFDVEAPFCRVRLLPADGG